VLTADVYMPVDAEMHADAAERAAALIAGTNPL